MFLHSHPSRDGEAVPALAGSALHAFDVKDRDRARLQSNPSPSSKISQRFVDRLARRTNQLCQLLLRQVVMHVHTVIPLIAKPLCQFQQLLCNPTGDVGKDEIGDHVVGSP